MENAQSYVPSAAGQDVAPSAAMQYCMQDYQDTLNAISGQWNDIHEMMTFCETFITSNDLLQHTDESDEEFKDRYASVISSEKAPEGSDSQLEQYRKTSNMYLGLYNIEYPGEWGDTLGDFFNPAGDSSYTEDIENYLPMAVALSEGQRSALAILSLDTLINIGLSTDEGIENLLPDISEILGDMESISVYSGSNRAIFRGGTAMTAEANFKANKIPQNAYALDKAEYHFREKLKDYGRDFDWEKARVENLNLESLQYMFTNAILNVI